MARPRLVSDQQILDAARSAVLERGAQVSLDVVAEHLGISAPGLLKRFGSRQNLLLAALSPDLEQLSSLFANPATEQGFAVALEAIIVRLAEYFRETMPRMMALRESVPHDVLHAHTKNTLPMHAANDLKRWLSAFHRRGLIDGDMLDTVAMTIVGAIMIRVVSAHLAQTPPQPKGQRKFETELTALFSRALSPPARSRTKKS